MSLETIATYLILAHDLGDWLPECDDERRERIYDLSQEPRGLADWQREQLREILGERIRDSREKTARYLRRLFDGHGDRRADQVVRNVRSQ